MLTAALVPLIPMAGCSPRATTAQCTEMLDRYLDMQLAAQPDTQDMPTDEARSTRDVRKARHKDELGYRSSLEQCEAEITRREYRCAMKATTPETWQSCID